MPHQQTLLITPGDPNGIGPEVTAKALARLAQDDPSLLQRVLLLCSHQTMADVLQKAGIQVPILETPSDEPLEVAAIRRASELLQRGQGRAMVTGPINKERLANAGFGFTGHTDFLGHLTGRKPIMAFVGGKVRVLLATVHQPLRTVSDTLTTDKVEQTVLTGDEHFKRHLGFRAPRWAVCGLNPHAGDGGLLGQEDNEIIAPAVKRLLAKGVKVTGPISAETAFMQAVRGEVDAVVAMYHDQGLVPLKALEAYRVIRSPNTEERSVNWSLNLPFVRTSVDHGTAYDKAGKDMADPGSMVAAIKLAYQLTGG